MRESKNFCTIYLRQCSISLVEFGILLRLSAVNLIFSDFVKNKLNGGLYSDIYIPISLKLHMTTEKTTFYILIMDYLDLHFTLDTRQPSSFYSGGRAGDT